MSWKNSNRRQRLPKDWEQRRRRVLIRDPICYICKSAPSTEVDHKERGDDHRLVNLGGTCTPCHRTKTAREGMEARRRKDWREPHPGEQGVDDMDQVH